MKKITLSTLLVALVGIVNAQIVYTDIAPDASTTLNPVPGFARNIQPIDFNGDNVEEYNFRWDDWGPGNGWFMHMTYAGNNEMVVDFPGSEFLVPLTLNTAINASSTWGNSLPEPFIGNDFNPNFQNLGDRYVGCKFTLGTNVHYGWVRVSFDNNLTLTIKDYAYESTPNTPILAGDGGVPSPIVLITSITVQGQGGNTSITTPGGTLQMLATVLPAHATHSTVIWSVRNTTGSATIDQFGLLTAVSDGEVFVKASANDGSGIEDSLAITISGNQVVGIHTGSLDDADLSLFPNPASEKLTIQLQNQSVLKSIQVLTITGKAVFSVDRLHKKQAVLDITDLDEGLYLLRIIDSDDRQMVRKVTVHSMNR